MPEFNLSQMLMPTDEVMIASVLDKMHQDAKRLRVFADGKLQGAADVGSTTAAGPHVMITWNWDELPDGIYIAKITGSLIVAQSNAAAIGYYPTCTQSTEVPAALGLTVTTARVTRLVYPYTWKQVEASGGTGLTFDFRVTNPTGTLSSVAPTLEGIAFLLS